MEANKGGKAHLFLTQLDLDPRNVSYILKNDLSQIKGNLEFGKVIQRVKLGALTIMMN